MKSQHFILIFLLLASLLYGGSSSAQFDPPDVPDDPVDTLPPEDVPFDGGLSILLAAGAGYGIRKIYKRHRQDDGTA